MKRIAIYKKDEVLPYVVFKGKSEIKQIRKDTSNNTYGERDYDGISVKMYSQRYQLFATQGRKCVRCGVERGEFDNESKIEDAVEKVIEWIELDGSIDYDK